MKIVFLVASMLAVAQAALIPSDVFYSLPMPKNQMTEITDNLDDGTFITRLDHTRPTDIRTVQFVSKTNTYYVKWNDNAIVNNKLRDM